MKRKKKGWRIALGLVAGFLLLNLVWYGVTTVQYKPFLAAVPEHVTGVHAMTKDGLSYNVKTPDYLSYVGNLAVSDDKAGIWLIIWPTLFGDDEYGVRIQDKQTGYELMVNDQLKLLEPDAELQAILDQNKPKITRLVEQAKTVFPLD